ncbi:DmsC/YnfH family molybdoenzyme membrane anchor subunit [Sulfuritalea sp.]|uniref:DmsC/YnfH family molybdoenzyme membrane anchor subunit n=1 Tax=Sulfuritalea sp. TaxID=2480090 RepID=UPI0025EE1C36|nr:DmsC/YnfH family molybdoenzyme membrane anchor subunit [Sulfuritalea sp.]
MRYASTIQTSWDWRAAANFIFGGTGSALLAASAWTDPASAVWFSAVLLGAALMGGGLTAVWLEIGRPWRAANVMLKPQNSWMTREAYVAATAFVLVAAALPVRWSWLAPALGVVGLTFLFCQARILHASKGVPAWHEASLQPLILTTGLTEGAAMLLLVQVVVSQDTRVSSLALLALLPLRLAAWHWYRKTLLAADPPKQVAAALPGLGSRFALPGHALPLALLILGGIAPLIGFPASIAAAFLALLSGWYFKLNLVTRLARVQGYGLGTLKRGHPLARTGHTLVSEQSLRLRRTRQANSNTPRSTNA